MYTRLQTKIPDKNIVFFKLFSESLVMTNSFGNGGSKISALLYKIPFIV